MKRLLREAFAMALVAALALALAAGGIAEAAETESPTEAAAETEIATGEIAAEAVEPEGDVAVRNVRFEEAEAPYEGVWVTFDDGFQLYLPGEWLSFEITEEQSEAGLFYRAGNDGSDDIVGDIPMGVAVSFVEAGGLTTLDELALDFESVGFSNLEELDLNGIPAVGFDKPEDGYRGVAFYHAAYPEYVMAIYVTPVGETGDAVRAAGDAILNSLTPHEPAAE